MSTKKQNRTALTTTISTPTKTFVGIDFLKRYSVSHALDEAGKDVDNEASKSSRITPPGAPPVYTGAVCRPSRETGSGDNGAQLVRKTNSERH